MPISFSPNVHYTHNTHRLRMRIRANTASQLLLTRGKIAHYLMLHRFGYSFLVGTKGETNFYMPSKKQDQDLLKPVVGLYNTANLLLVSALCR